MSTPRINTEEARDLIEQSRERNEIVHARLDGADTPALELALVVEADDSVENGTVTEYWGEDWRVHVHHASAEWEEGR